MDKNPEILKTISLLANDEQDILESAIFSLSNYGNGVVEELVSALSSPNENIRQNVASCLGLIKDPNTIKNLFNLLLDPRQNVQVSAAWALNSFDVNELKQQLNIPEGMSDDMEKALKHSNWQIRWYGINFLSREVEMQGQNSGSEERGNVLNDKLTELLLPALKDSYLAVRLSAIWRLEELYNETIKEYFIELLGDLNEQIRSEIALVFSRNLEEDSVPALAKRLQYDLNDNVRLSAVLALSNIGGEIIKPALLIAINDKNEYVRAEAINAMITTNSGVYELENIYLNALNDKSKYVFRNTIKNLAIIGLTKTRETLFDILKTEKDNERIANIIEVLGIFKEKKVLNVILPFAKHPYWQIKMKVAAALGKIGDKKNINVLLDMLQDPNEFVKESAIISLGLMGTRKIISKLEKICDDFPYNRLGIAARRAIMSILDRQG